MFKYATYILLILFLYSCSSAKKMAENNKSEPEENYLGYQPRDPVPAKQVMIYDSVNNAEKKVYWASISENKTKGKLLPNQSAQVSIKQTSFSGEIGYLGASVSGERGNYEVIMDYMKYRVEDIFDEEGNYIGNGHIGVGLRIKAKVVTSSMNINLGSLMAIGVAAELNDLRGSISVDVIGLDSENITNLIPLTSEINQTSIQSSLQALASIKSKLWEPETSITPHLIAFKQHEPDSEKEIVSQLMSVSYEKTNSGDAIRKYWKPDGKKIDQQNETKLKNWMQTNLNDSDAGSITMFIVNDKLNSERLKAIKDLKIKD